MDQSEHRKEKSYNWHWACFRTTRQKLIERIARWTTPKRQGATKCAAGTTIKVKEVDHKMDRLRFVLLLSVILGTPAQLAFAVSGDPAKGKAVYEKQCLFCHGAQGKGDGSLGKSLVPPPADLSNIKTKSDEEVLKTIQNGRPPTAMPGFKGQLSAQEIQDALAYIRTFGR